MSVAPGPTASRGDITIQPAYFTSSRFVYPLRDDITNLIHAFHDQYVHTQSTQPFALFKNIWLAQGWQWFHFKVFDARTRESFLKVTMRLFIERMVPTEAPLCRVVALYALYTFYYTQLPPCTPPLYRLTHVPLPIDLYASIISLPSTLTSAHLLHLQPTTTHIISTLVNARVFYILPPSELFPLNPRDLPREIFEHDAHTLSSGSVFIQDGVKKKGRPSKREKMKKAKDALAILEKWLEKNTYIPPASGTAVASTSKATSIPSHILLSHPPITSRYNYQTEKATFLDAIERQVPQKTYAVAGSTDSMGESDALKHANEVVLLRMRKIDQLAAAKGLEVGGEGGVRTGLGRVEKAFAELNHAGELGRRGGILGLLEGGGMNDSDRMVVDETPVT